LLIFGFGFVLTFSFIGVNANLSSPLSDGFNIDVVFAPDLSSPLSDVFFFDVVFAPSLSYFLSLLILLT